MASSSARPSEFGGKPQRNTIQPPRTPAGTIGHVHLTPEEKLRMVYLTGQTADTTRVPDPNHESFEGLDLVAEAKKRATKPVLYRDL